jgi:CheY-like chemotaxis protein
MQILLVEDDELKAQRIAEHLIAFDRTIQLVRARSVNSALRAIASTDFDVIVLDMTLPAFDIGTVEDGGGRKPYGGREVLGQMDVAGLIVPTIVITQFDRFGEGDRALSIGQLHDQLDRAFDSYTGIVQYRADSYGWKKLLNNQLDFAMKMGRK